MKIVYLYTALTTVGGADRIITQKANYLADEMGYDVYILTDSQNGRPPIFPLSKNGLKVLEKRGVRGEEAGKRNPDRSE